MARLWSRQTRKALWRGSPPPCACAHSGGAGSGVEGFRFAWRGRTRTSADEYLQQQHQSHPAVGQPCKGPVHVLLTSTGFASGLRSLLPTDWRLGLANAMLDRQCRASAVNGVESAANGLYTAANRTVNHRVFSSFSTLAKRVFAAEYGVEAKVRRESRSVEAASAGRKPVTTGFSADSRRSTTR